MAEQGGSNDFIARVRQRHHDVPAAVPADSRTFVVQITRDGRAMETLTFDRAPSIGAIAARAGTEAYVLSIDVIHHGDDRLAAE